MVSVSGYLIGTRRAPGIRCAQRPSTSGTSTTLLPSLGDRLAPDAHIALGAIPRKVVYPGVPT
jgi:hypothetical protein